MMEIIKIVGGAIVAVVGVVGAVAVVGAVGGAVVGAWKKRDDKEEDLLK